jgi:hypothetical protein
VADRVDLLSVVTHEFGHVLGFEHDDSGSVMDAWLSPGESLTTYRQAKQALVCDLFSGSVMLGLIGRLTGNDQMYSGSVGANGLALSSELNEWDSGMSEQTTSEVANGWILSDRKARNKRDEIAVRERLFGSLEDLGLDEFRDDQQAIDVELDILVEQL